MRKKADIKISIILDDSYQNIQIMGDVIGDIMNGDYQNGSLKDYGDGNNSKGLTIDSIGKCVSEYLHQFKEFEKYKVEPQKESSFTEKTEETRKSEI